MCKNFFWALVFSFLSLYAQEILIKKCPKCQYLEKNKDAKYCMHCGNKLIESAAMEVFLCPKCNKTLHKTEHYCPVCGGKIMPHCPICGQKGILVHQEIQEENYNPLTPTPASPIPQKQPEKKQDIPKNFEQFVYPGSTLIEKHVMDEGFFYSARNREIQKLFYKCQSDIEEIEEYYRKLYPEISIIRFFDDILKTHGLFLKYTTKNNEIIELNLFTFSDYPKDTWDSIHKKVQSKIQEEIKPAAQIEKEIANLQKMIQEGKISASKSQDRLQDLQKRFKLAINTKSYWHLYAREKVCSSGHNILLLNVTFAK